MLNGGALDKRFCRLSITIGAETLEDQGFQTSIPQPYDLEDATKVHLGGPIIRYPAIGACIYCGAKEFKPNTGLPLSEEHIIAEGIGGSIVLPASSCHECNKITCAIESDVQRSMFLAPKRHLGIFGKNRSPRDEYPLTAIGRGKDRVVLLTMAEHPAFLFLMNLLEPNLFQRRPPSQASGLAGAWLHILGSIDELKAKGIVSCATPPFDSLRFCQFLAKTAHGYACAHALDFQPMLIPFIKRRFGRREYYLDCFDLVGGYRQNFAPSSGAIHELALRVAEHDGAYYAAVHIRLFASLGAPLYTVIVGRLNQVPPRVGRALL